MSEYQYYEWQSIDRPLTSEEQGAVNGLSSHIAVSSSGAVVTYHWSSFRHDVKDVLTRYFDAFMYYANWGSQRFMMRLPAHLVDMQAIEPYCWEYVIEIEEAGESIILDIAVHKEDSSYWEERDWSLSALAPLRADVLRGDYRCLYLAWLRAAELNDAEDDEVEPPVPAGLRDMSAALHTFVDFFELDDHLVAAAAQASPAPSVARQTYSTASLPVA